MSGVPAGLMPCPVCANPDVSLFAKARDVELFTSDRTYRYAECRRCSAVYLHDPPTDRLDEIYPASYYSYANESAHKGIAATIKEALDARMFRRLLDRIPGGDLRVLDVGGGSGWLLSQVRKLSSRVAHTHEVEISETAREAAEAAGHHFHCTSIETFESSETFDLVLMLNLIEHVADPRAVLNAMRRLLSPRGVVLIKTPNTDTLDRRLFQHHYWGGLHCPRHWVLFTMTGLSTLANECGLEVVAASYTQGSPQWTTSLLSQFSDWGLVKLSHDRPMSAHPLLGTVLTMATAAFDFVRAPFAPTAQMFLTLRSRPRRPGPRA